MPTLETERLLMRPFEPGDLDEWAAIMADPEVTRYLTGTPLSRDDAWRAMALFLGHDRLRGWSNNALIEKATGRLVGRAGLFMPEGWPGLEVGWVLGRFAWRHGFATEAAAAWRDYAFETLDVDELIAIIHPDNPKSVAVAARIGMGFLRDEDVRGERRLIYGVRNASRSTASRDGTAR